MKAIDLSPYIIAKSNLAGDSITNKKLNKLLYYVKAWGVVYFDDGVIDDDFEAWMHGPVCPPVYQEYKKYGFSPIPLFSDEESAQNFVNTFDRNYQDTDKLDMINAVFNKYGQLTAMQLELLSHQETPWMESRKGLSPIEQGHSVISVESMRRFYGKE